MVGLLEWPRGRTSFAAASCLAEPWLSPSGWRCSLSSRQVFSVASAASSSVQRCCTATTSERDCRNASPPPDCNANRTATQPVSPQLFCQAVLLAGAARTFGDLVLGVLSEAAWCFHSSSSAAADCRSRSRAADASRSRSSSRSAHCRSATTEIDFVSDGRNQRGRKQAAGTHRAG